MLLDPILITKNVNKIIKYENTKTLFNNPDWTFLSKQPDFQKTYLTHMNSESHKRGGVGKINLRYLPRYLETHLTHPEIGVMVV